jgi:hypothetical protein
VLRLELGLHLGHVEVRVGQLADVRLAVPNGLRDGLSLGLEVLSRRPSGDRSGRSCSSGATAESTLRRARVRPPRTPEPSGSRFSTTASGVRTATYATVADFLINGLAITQGPPDRVMARIGAVRHRHTHAAPACNGAQPVSHALDRFAA